MATKPQIPEARMNASTFDIVNAIRMDTPGLNFKDRIPACSKETLQQIGDIFSSDSDLANSFMTELINRVGMVMIQQKRYSNNLKAVKQGKLDFGETVEEIAYGLIHARCDYNVDTGVTDVFQINKATVATALHKVNYQQKYPVSFTHFELRKAFTTAASLGDFIEGIITSVYNSYEVDEQLAFKNLIVQATEKNFFYPIEIDLPDDEATGKIFVKKVKQFANVMQFMNTNFNKYHLPQFTNKDDLIILIRADIDAAIEVDVLAAAFQAYAVDFVGSGRKIMVDDFGNDNIYAIVCDRRFFQIYDYDLAMDKIYNPSNRVWNYFLHVWEVISASPFMQGVAIVATGSGTITGVTVTPATATVAKGKNKQFVAVVEGTGIFNGNVSWTVEGAVSANTTIDSSGILRVGEDETASLTVKATSAGDSTKSATATVTVS